MYFFSWKKENLFCSYFPTLCYRINPCDFQRVITKIILSFHLHFLTSQMNFYAKFCHNR
jgi:hypothetical protein